MKEHHSREVLQRYLVLFCVALVFYFAHQDQSPPSEKPPLPKQDWSSILYEIAGQNSDFVIPAIQEAMHDIQTFVRGENLSWPECDKVRIEVSLRPVLLSGKNLMAITDKTHIESLDENGQINIQAEWLVATWLWNTWDAQRAEGLWHELFHLRQICRLMVEVDTTQGLERANRQFITVLRAHRAEMEAEVLGAQAYWHIMSADEDSDLVLEGSVNEKGETLLSIWTSLYGTNADVFLALDGVGVPRLSDHSAWIEWVARVNEVYVGPLTSD